MAEESARRAANIRTVRRSVKMWREKNSVQSTNLDVGAAETETEAAAAATAAAIDKLHTILNDCQERGGEDADSYLALLLNLPRLIDSKADILADEAANMERKVRELQFVAGRYRAETDVVATGAAVGGGGSGGGGTGGQQQQQMTMVEHPMQEPIEAALM